MLLLTEVWVAALEQEQDEAWAGRFPRSVLAQLTKSASWAGPRFGSTLHPPIPSLIFLAWDWEQPKSDHWGSISPFNHLSDLARPLLSVTHDCPNHSRGDPRSLPCDPAPGDFSALCPYLASLLLLLLFFFFFKYSVKASLVAQSLKCLPGMRETWVRSLGREDPLEKEMAIHSCTLAWRIPWKVEPGRLQSLVSLGVGHD